MNNRVKKNWSKVWIRRSFIRWGRSRMASRVKARKLRSENINVKKLSSGKSEKT